MLKVQSKWLIILIKQTELKNQCDWRVPLRCDERKAALVSGMFDAGKDILQITMKSWDAETEPLLSLSFLSFPLFLSPFLSLFFLSLSFSPPPFFRKGGGGANVPSAPFWIRLWYIVKPLCIFWTNQMIFVFLLCVLHSIPWDFYVI